MNKVVVECRKIGYSAIGMFSILIIIISFLLGSCYMDSDYRSYTVIEMFFLPKRQEVLSNIEMNWLTIWANSINGPVNSSGSIKYWISVCIIRGAGKRCVKAVAFAGERQILLHI